MDTEQIVCNGEILATVQDPQFKNMLQVTGNEVKKVAE